MYYTPAQVQEMLNIPPSTLRNYAKKFEEYLSPQTGRKQRLYTEKDLLIFGQIIDLAAANIPMAVIGSRLTTTQQEPARPQDSALALIPSVAREIESAQESARQAHTRIEQQAEQLAHLADRVDQQAQQLANFQTHLYKPWWKRLFTRPPHL